MAFSNIYLFVLNFSPDFRSNIICILTLELGSLEWELALIKIKNFTEA